MKKVLLVGDVKNWAMHHIYLYMEKELRKRYIVNYVTGRKFSFFKDFYLRRYDVIYVMYGLLLDGFKIDQSFHNKIITGVHCHWEFCDQSSVITAANTSGVLSEKYLKTLQLANRVAGISWELCSILKKDLEHVFYLPHAIDIEIFHPQNRRIKGKNKLIRVGWAQSENNHGFKRRIDSIRKVFSRVEGVQLAEINKEIGLIKDRKQLCDWYNTLDCYVCFSLFEGGPLPVLEAMACGIPCISTPVGQVPEVIQNNENGFIVHTEEDLYKVLVFVRDHSDCLVTMSDNARNYMVNNRAPDKVISYWIDFLDL